MTPVEILDILIKLAAAIILGGAVGLERSLAHKHAGLRTFALVSLGAALFTITSDIIGRSLPLGSFDPSRIASQIVVGIGFLGAGVIIFHRNKLQGLTTAAGLWVAAAIGLACGLGLYSLALVATALTMLILTFLWPLEEKLMRFYDREGGD